MSKSLISKSALCWFGAALFLLASGAQAQTSVWEVSNGEHQVLIGATTSLLGSSAYPLPAEFEQAYKIADKIYVQTDLTELTSPQFGLKVMQANIYRDGRNLRSVLAPATWQALQSFSARRQLPVMTMLMFKPAFAVATLTLAETKRLNLGRGVDAHFLARARASGKAVGLLESPDQQLALLSQLNTIDPDKLIAATLTELDAMDDKAEPVTAAWRRGDMAEFDRLMGKKLRAQAPELHNTLVSARSRAWLSELQIMLTTAELEFLVLDALHLSGPENLLQLLRDKGYKVSVYELY